DSVPDAAEPGPLFHRDRARTVPERQWSISLVATDAGLRDLRGGYSIAERDALPQTAGLAAGSATLAKVPVLIMSRNDYPVCECEDPVTDEEYEDIYHEALHCLGETSPVGFPF